jgi:hippurate hydrolase
MKSLIAALLLATAAPALAAPVDLVSLYKDLHMHPELSGQEVRSAAILAAEARAAGFEVTEKVGGTGVVAVMKNGPGPVVLVRADMDALPVKETTGLPYASTATGKMLGAAADAPMTPVMHACGHDIHMTVWAGTARWLAENRKAWRGTVVMIGQPAEEANGGAEGMLKDGLFTRFPKPNYALALHDSAEIPAGSVSVPPKEALAAGSFIDIEIPGKGGHGAYPATTHDPVVLAARIIMGLQPLVSRENNPFDPAVVTVGSVHSGTKHNIIPDSAHLQLTVRSYDQAVQKRLLDGIARVARNEAAAAGFPANLMPVVTGIENGTPPTLNTPELAARVEAAMIAKMGKARVPRIPPSMASEDFNRYYLADPSIQSVIFWVGGVPQDVWDKAKRGEGSLPSLHNSAWAPDPAPTIAAGVEAMTTAVVALLPPK